MALSVVQYLEIRSRLYSIDCDPGKLETLKVNFREIINSQRVFDRVNSLPDLLNVLEKRDALSPECIDELLIQGIPDYINNNHITSNIERVLKPLPLHPREQIIEMIKSQIGHSWQELAEALSITEGNIDKLKKTHNDNVCEIVDEILRHHQEKCGKHEEIWRSELQQALFKAKRQPLSKKIDDILILNS